MVGSHGPDFVIGKATNRGFHQSVLSKQLKPPVKWSYRKLILSWALVFLSIGWIVFYINAITKRHALPTLWAHANIATLFRYSFGPATMPITHFFDC